MVQPEWWAVFNSFVDKVYESRTELFDSQTASSLQASFELFADLDKDKNGGIEPDEFDGLLEALGLNDDALDAAELFKDMDSDGSGTIDFSEFVHWISTTFAEDNEECSDDTVLQLLSVGIEVCRMSKKARNSETWIVGKDAFNIIQQAGLEVPDWEYFDPENSGEADAHELVNEMLATRMQLLRLGREIDSELDAEKDDDDDDDDDDEYIEEIEEIEEWELDSEDELGAHQDQGRARSTTVARRALAAETIEEASVSDTSVTFEGVLHKKKDTKWGKQDYLRRYFVLHGKFLTYYATQGDSEPLGKMDLTGAQAMAVKRDPLAFLLSGPHIPNKYQLQAESVAQRATWIQKMQQAVKQNTTQTGWMYKQKKPTQPGFPGEWALRYFVLSDTELRYFASAQCQKELGALNLIGACVEHLPLDGPHGYTNGFILDGPHFKRRYVFATKTETLRTAWTTKLMAVSTSFAADMEHNVMRVDADEPVGRHVRLEGYRPRRPLVIIHGLMGAGMVCEQSSEEPDWEGQRVWLSLRRIMRKKESQMIGDDVVKDTWIRHIVLNPKDGKTDPPGIRVRPMKGFEAVDFLEDVWIRQELSVMRKSLYVMGPLIESLRALGYDDTTMAAAPYDWRLSIKVLQERDGYFNSLMELIEKLYNQNQQPVTILSHSMGCRVTQYFLHWVNLKWGPNGNGRAWLDKHIYSWAPCAGPFLGAAKGVRAILVGEKMGLPFMKDHEALQFSRGMGSSAQVLPFQGVQPFIWINARRGSYSVRLKTLELKQSYCRLAAKDGKNEDFNVVVEIQFKDGGTTLQSQSFSKRKALTGSDSAECNKTTNDNPNVWMWEDVDEQFFFDTPHFGRVMPADCFNCTARLNGMKIGTGCVQVHDVLKPGGVRTSKPCIINIPLKWDKGNSGSVDISISIAGIAENPPPAWNLPIWWDGGKKGRVTEREALEKYWSPLFNGALSKYIPQTIESCLYQEGLHKPLEWQDELFADSCFGPVASTSSVMQAPPIKRTLCIIGTNLKTEVCLFLKHRQRSFRLDPRNPISHLTLDPEAQHPGLCCAGGVGYEIQRGMPVDTVWTGAWDPETETYKDTAGDGTIPYASAKWPVTWRKYGLDVEVVEIDKAEHRGILNNRAFHECIMKHICIPPVFRLQLYIIELRVIKKKVDVLPLTAEYVCSTWWDGVEYTTGLSSDGKWAANNLFEFGIPASMVSDRAFKTIDIKIWCVNALEKLHKSIGVKGMPTGERELLGVAALSVNNVFETSMQVGEMLTVKPATKKIEEARSFKICVQYHKKKTKVKYLNEAPNFDNVMSRETSSDISSDLPGRHSSVITPPTRENIMRNDSFADW